MCVYNVRIYKFIYIYIISFYTVTATDAILHDAEEFYCWQQWVPVKRVCDENKKNTGKMGGGNDVSFENWFPGMCRLRAWLTHPLTPLTENQSYGTPAVLDNSHSNKCAHARTHTILFQPKKKTR